MNRSKKIRSLKKFALFSLLFACLLNASVPSFAGEDNEVSPANKTQISLMLGPYVLSKTGVPSLDSFGAFSIGFTYRFLDRLNAEISYNNLMSWSGSLTSISSGIDIGASYCFFSCTAMKQKLADSGLAVSWSPWGVLLGAGFSERTFDLSNATVGFAGPYGKAVLTFMLSDHFKLLSAAQISAVTNGSNALTVMTLQLGVGFDFGENVYNSIHK